MLVAFLADKFGSSDAAVRLLLGILAAYPVAAIYRKYIEVHNSTNRRHAYLTLCGLVIGFFNYGTDICHSIICVLVTYVLLHALQHRSTRLMVGLNWCFQMTYLLVGYYYTEHDDYDISWTMPQCVLCLRLIGLAFDVSDGKKSHRQLSKEQLAAVIPEAPSLLEIATYVYLPSAFLVGPQFPMRRFKAFIAGNYVRYTGNTRYGLQRCALGFLYFAIYMSVSSYYPNDYFGSEAYFQTTLVHRLFDMGVWGKMTLCKYMAIWLMSEGALVCLGFTYNGMTSSGEPDWSGCTNVRVWLLETGDTMAHYVQSFNVNTNQWLSQYTYKRLKFLGNRTISYGAALFFLALWHGFHDGYYAAFFFEYIIVSTEKQVEEVYESVVMSKYGNVLKDSLLYKAVKRLFMRIYNHIFMGWCLCPFILLNHTRWIPALAGVYFYGIVYCAVWFVFYQLVYMKSDSFRQTRLARRVEAE